MWDGLTGCIVERMIGKIRIDFYFFGNTASTTGDFNTHMLQYKSTFKMTLDNLIPKKDTKSKRINPDQPKVLFQNI